MLPTGHLSAGYLISQIPFEKKTVLKWYEVVFIMFCAVVFDFDFFLPPLFGYPVGTHHFFPTHTPLAGMVYFGVFYMVFRKIFSKKTFILAGVGLLSHLVLDDLSYWLFLAGLEEPVRAQIFWWWPFDKRLKVETDLMLQLYKNKPWDSNDVLIMHLFKIPRLFYLEIALPVAAFVVYVKNSIKYRSIIRNGSKAEKIH
jgi:hypothetical protein